MPDEPLPVDEAWHAALTELLENAYLAAPDPRGQSGFRGDAARWEAARRVIAVAIHRDGAFLDIGCANGYLLETLSAWSADDGHAIAPWGLDISPRMAALARARLPQWAARIHVGNALTWKPPRRFDFVRTELVYVPDTQQRAYVARLLAEYFAPGGRLIVCSYGSSRRPPPRAEPPGELLRAWGWDVAGEARAADPENGVVITEVAWVEAR